MAHDTGPPKGTIKLMTPFEIAPDPPPPKPIPDLAHPDKSPSERATERFSLEGKRAIGMYVRGFLYCIVSCLSFDLNTYPHPDLF